MSKAKMIIATTFGVFALSVMVTNAAMAAGSWFVAGTKLPVGGEVGLAATAVVDSPTVLNEAAESIKITCTGSSVDNEDDLVRSPEKEFIRSVKYLGCSELTPSHCTVETTIETETEAGRGILILAFTISPSTVGKIFSPESGSTLAVIGFAGTTCAVAGEKPLNGSVTLHAPSGQIESTLQAVEDQGSVENNSLRVAGHPAFLEGGRVLLKLASGSRWSFHP